MSDHDVMQNAVKHTYEERHSDVCDQKNALRVSISPGIVWLITM